MQPLSITDGSIPHPRHAERLEKLTEQRRRRLRVVRGHLYYGVHEFLPQGATYITMLREPVARFLSSYYFIQRRPLHPMHRKVTTERVGVEDFIRLTPHRQNLQCRLIAGIKDEGMCEERILDQAKENLMKSFSVAGICSDSKKALWSLRKALTGRSLSMRTAKFQKRDHKSIPAQWR
jgi:hypothetical protein